MSAVERLSRPRPLGPSAAPRILGFAAILVALVAVMASVSGQTLVLPAVTVVVLALAVDRWPFQFVMITVALSVTVLPDPLISIEVAGVRTDPVEFLVIGFLLRWTARTALGHSPTPPAMLRPVLLLVAAGGMSALVAVSRGAEWSGILYDVKTLAFLGLALPLSEILHDPLDRRRAVRWILILAAVASAYVVIAIGTGGALPSGNTVSSVDTLGVVTQTSRVRLNILALDFLAVFLLFPRVMRRGPGLVPVVVGLVPILAVIVFSLNRSTWLPLLVGWVGFLIWEQRDGNGRMPVLLAVVGVSVLALALLLGSNDILGRRGNIVSSRALSVLDSGVVDESSLQDRSAENDAAVEAIRQDPLFGVGLGQEYGHRKLTTVPGTDVRTLAPTDYIHNSSLGLWLNYGLAGVLAVLWLAFEVARSPASRSLRRSEHRALVMCMLGFALQAQMAGSLSVRPTILVVSLCLALLTPGRAERPDDAPVAAFDIAGGQQRALA